jgi:alkanesulfonate monooxygenase SsuD/methylene tetrahydromethanopterin reductase-like flavin-dependent oxidoreductase (luciferase family)
LKLGLSLPVFTADARRPLAAAERAADAGYAGVFAPDHLLPPGRTAGPTLDPFTILSAVAARQAGTVVGTLVTRVSIRPAGLLAKLGAALDQLSGGRAILGLGSGDSKSRPEHEAFGFPFRSSAARVAVLDEASAALTDLFEGRPWPGGSHVPAIAGPLLPPGRPAIWIGGRSEAVVAAAARRAEAWNGWGLDVDGFRGAAAALGRLADGRAVDATWGGIVLVGRDGADLDRRLADRRGRGLPEDIWQGTSADLRSFARRIEDAGASWLIAQAVGGDDAIELIAEAVLA